MKLVSKKMKVLDFEYQGLTVCVELEGLSGQHKLFVAGINVEQQPVTDRLFSDVQFRWQNQEFGELRLKYRLDMLGGFCQFEFYKDEQLVVSEQQKVASGFTEASVQPVVENHQQTTKNQHWLGLFGLGFKLFKSAKAVKVLLAGGALAGWSIIFSWQFAVVLIAAIMFHEAGHVWAMKRLGMKTKGVYLIPFVGGVAIGDKAKTHWQQVFIAMMGPCFGLLMAVAFYLAYLLTGSHYVGLLASVSALLNIFNLLPVMPLDGGQVVKSIAFSGRSRWPYLLLLSLSAAFFALSIQLGLSLLAFFIVLGVIDLIFSRQELKTDTVVAMDRYGCVFSAVWYIATVVGFLAIIYAIASSGLPGSEIAIAVLES